MSDITMDLGGARRRPARRGPFVRAGAAVRSVAESLSVTGRVLWALMLRDFRAQYAHRRLGLLWAFMPPLYMVAFFVIMFTLIRHNTAPIGHSVGPFVALGALNLLLFQSVMKAVSRAAQAGKALLVFPRVKVLDLYLSRYLTSLAVLTVVFTTFMAAFVFFGQIGPPDQLERVLVACALVSIIGFGMGLIDTVLSRRISGWDLVWRVVSRTNFMTSGLFFVADGMPGPVKAILWYQPLLHTNEWIRSGYYASFESRFYDWEYPASVALGVLILGLLLERTERANILSTKRRR